MPLIAHIKTVASTRYRSQLDLFLPQSLCTLNKHTPRVPPLGGAPDPEDSTELSLVFKEEVLKRARYSTQNWKGHLAQYWESRLDWNGAQHVWKGAFPKVKASTSDSGCYVFLTL